MSDDYEVLRDFIVDAVDDGASIDAAERAKLALKALQEENERLGSMLSAANDAEVALQERAEKAEAALRELAEALYDRRIYDNGIPQYEPTRNRKEVRLIHALNAARALSPTQETDPE